MAYARVEDLTGRHFGKLLVLGRAPSGDDRRTLWNCECGCGRKAVVRATLLQQGRTKSCGCLKRAWNEARQLDLTGQRFGQLQVLRFARKSANGKSRSLCKCDCGRTSTVLNNNLKSGATKSCGCGRRALATDLVGKRFGKLQVLGRARNKGRQARFTCRCECGRTFSVFGFSLSSGHTRSCGCAQKDWFLDLTGRRFGKLTVLRRAKGKLYKGKKPYWKCKCECGRSVTVRGYSLRKGYTRSCGCLRQFSGAFPHSATKVNGERTRRTSDRKHPAHDKQATSTLPMTHKNIVELLRGQPDLQGKTIATRMRLAYDYCRRVLGRLVKAGLLVNTNRGYRASEM